MSHCSSDHNSTNYDSTEVEGHSSALLKMPEEVSNRTDPCDICEGLRTDKKKLQRKIKTMENKIDGLKQKIISSQADWTKCLEELNRKVVVMVSTGETVFLHCLCFNQIYPSKCQFTKMSQKRLFFIRDYIFCVISFFTIYPYARYSNL